jgi:sec-independent protein translocase protein TatC
MFFLLNYILSILLTYFFIFPNLLNFFLIFEKNNIFFPLHFEAKIEEFFSVMFVLFFNITLSFQIPILLYILIYNNIIDIYFIIKNRKIFYLFFLILSAFIAPPEILTQFFIFILIIFLFEFFIFINIFYNNI